MPEANTIMHCGFCLHPKVRELLPTPKEQLNGIQRVIVREYHCPGKICRRRLLYWQRDERLSFSKVEARFRPGLIKRLATAPASDVVTGWNHKYGYQTQMAVQ